MLIPESEEGDGTESNYDALGEFGLEVGPTQLGRFDITLFATKPRQSRHRATTNHLTAHPTATTSPPPAEAKRNTAKYGKPFYSHGG